MSCCYSCSTEEELFIHIRISGYLVSTFDYCVLPHCLLKTSPECHFFRYNQTKCHHIITCCVSRFQSGLPSRPHLSSSRRADNHLSLLCSLQSHSTHLFSLSLETLPFNLSTTLFCVPAAVKVSTEVSQYLMLKTISWSHGQGHGLFPALCLEQLCSGFKGRTTL